MDDRTYAEARLVIKGLQFGITQAFIEKSEEIKQMALIKLEEILTPENFYKQLEKEVNEATNYAISNLVKKEIQDMILQLTTEIIRSDNFRSKVKRKISRSLTNQTKPII